MKEIYFWQGIISPHMFELAAALAQNGIHVTYVAQQRMVKERAEQGWHVPTSDRVRLHIAASEKEIAHLLSQAPKDAVHLVQGVYANGKLERVRRQIKKRNLQWGATMETIDERQWYWPIKRLLYTFRLWPLANRPNFILATGKETPQWVKARLYPEECIFPFTYFIPQSNFLKSKKGTARPTRVGTAARLIPLKRIDLIFSALKHQEEQNILAVVIGDGPLRNELEQRAIIELGHARFEFLGKVEMRKVPNELAELDCLILASDYDGWGVVVTEALMQGTPCICSDACGSAEAVEASGVGGVFPKGDVHALSRLLSEVIANQRDGIYDRQTIRNWSTNFSVETGAKYLIRILEHTYENKPKPVPPWRICDVYYDKRPH